MGTPNFVIPHLGDALVILGVFILTVGVYGLIRLPDTYLKLHPGSKAVLLGLLPLLLAAALTGDPAMVYRAALIAVALLLTAPISAHEIAKAAYQRGEKAPGIAEARGGETSEKSRGH